MTGGGFDVSSRFSMKGKYIKQLKVAHQRLLKAFDLTPDDGKIVDRWSKKEIMAHIAGWYEEGVEGVLKILNGEKPTSFKMSVNSYNKRSIEKRKNMTIEQLRDEMIKLHDQWLKQIKALDENQITDFYGTKLGKKDINLLWMIKEAISHDNAHAQELEKKFS